MILVTGGTGLVGSHLLYHLTFENDDIIAIYRTEEKLTLVKKVFSYYTEKSDDYFSKIQWIKADLTDIPSLQIVFENPISKIYHCAALVSFDPKDYYKMRHTNIEGTANLVNLAIANNIERFCFVSSIAAIGDSIDNKEINEENEWVDNGDKHGYAITKYGAEMEVWRGSQEGLDVVIVNPGVILGSGFFNEGSGKMFTQVYNGFKFYTEGVTGFVSVKDVVKAMIQLTESDIRNERFILVAENISFKDILFSIAKYFNVKQPSIKASPLMTSIFWRIDWFLTLITGKTPLMTKNSARSSHNKEAYDTSKIIDILNFKFQKIDDVIQEVCSEFNM
ncbi:NAD-dependent epimerase/dehydratase family protein [Tenacibaculum sp. 190524A05c]|uniref:NAD-dependent epimerase/dehydratase family protein n=1 Tax=Tenacibaculum platacis TaxID=3137852 RepID=UPI0032B1F78D